MSSSLPARPSLEQLKKVAKYLVKAHAEKDAVALKVIGDHLPALAGKTLDEIAAYEFKLHDAQSVVARQYGYASWQALTDHIATLQTPLQPGPESVAPVEVDRILRTVLEARTKVDYAMLSSICSTQFLAFVTKEVFEAPNVQLSAYFAADYKVAYMGALRRLSGPVHFWRLWVPGWDSDLLIRMVLNESGKISGLLYSDPFDTGIGKRK